MRFFYLLVSVLFSMQFMCRCTQTEMVVNTLGNPNQALAIALALREPRLHIIMILRGVVYAK